MSSSRTIGDLALVEPGAQVWSRERRWAGVDELPIGGVVVDVVDTVDAETGELRRAFVVLAWHHGKPVTHTLAEAEVDRETMQPTTASSIRNLVRRLWALGANTKGPFTTQEADIAKWTHTLIGRVL